MTVADEKAPSVTTTGTKRITCVIAGDHPAVLDAVARTPAAGGVDVLAQVRDGEDAVRAIESHQPDFAVVDVRLRGISGLAVARRVASQTAIVLYTARGDRALVVEALEAGVRGFVLKEAPLADLGRAIATLAAGASTSTP